MLHPANNQNIPGHLEGDDRLAKIMQYTSLYKRGALSDQELENKLKQFLLNPGSDDHCVWCKGSMHITDDRLTPGLARTLLKLKGAVFVKGENDIKIHKLNGKLAFTLSEHSNFHKLRKHGLVHWVKKDGKIQRGHWLITRKGWDFLAGVPIAEVVFTYNDEVVAHSDEETTLSQVIREDKYWRDIDDYLATRLPANTSILDNGFVPKYT